jgi:hypothetical protein
MLSLIPRFSPGQDARRPPFDPGQAPAEECLSFLYVTGRGRYSPLFPCMSLHAVLTGAGQTIPMGHTSIWVLEWRMAAGPETPGRTRALPKPSRRRAAENLDKGTPPGGKRRNAYRGAIRISGLDGQARKKPGTPSGPSPWKRRSAAP